MLFDLEKTLAQSDAYDEQIKELARQNKSVYNIYEELLIRFTASACEELTDGFAELEISPKLAHSTGRIIEEARRLWSRIGKKNLMIKIPDTNEGLRAVKELVSEGINASASNALIVDLAASYDNIIRVLEKKKRAISA